MLVQATNAQMDLPPAHLPQGTECGDKAGEVLQGAPVLLLCLVQPVLVLVQQPQLQVGAGQQVEGLIRQLQVKGVGHCSTSQHDRQDYW